MRLVLLTAHSPEGEIQHRFVAKMLAEQFPDELKAIIVATGDKATFAKRTRRWVSRYSFAEICSRIAVRITGKISGRDRKRQRIFESIFFPAGDDGFMPRRDILQCVLRHNDQQCLDLIGQLRPDIIIVYGTLIIGRKLIDASPQMINLHTGYSPFYRGSDTIFWALYNDDLQHLGVTVHRLDPGVDTGPILARGTPLIETTDDEARLWAKATRLGASLLCRAVTREIAGLTKPLNQDLSKGREFRSVERTMAAERRLTKMLRHGLIKQDIPPWSEEF